MQKKLENNTIHFLLFQGYYQCWAFLPKKKDRSSIHWLINVDWGGDVDTRKSLGGFLFFIKRNSSYLEQQEQQNKIKLCLLSTQFEYRAFMEASKEVEWLLDLLVELKMLNASTIPIYCDNENYIKIAKDPIFHSRTKHFAIHLKHV